MEVDRGGEGLAGWTLDAAPLPPVVGKGEETGCSLELDFPEDGVELDV
jgi:hypothetical protein